MCTYILMRYVETEYELWSIRADHMVDMILLLRSLFHLWYLFYELMVCYGINVGFVGIFMS